MQRLDWTTKEDDGVHGLGVMNDNGERFVNACAADNIVIGGNVFPHKRIHKATWVSPDQVTENQIDHIGINTMFRRSLQDVWVKRGADVASDHHFVTASKIKTQPKKKWRRSRKKKGKIQCGLSEGSKHSTRIQSYIK